MSLTKGTMHLNGEILVCELLHKKVKIDVKMEFFVYTKILNDKIFIG